MAGVGDTHPQVGRRQREHPPDQGVQLAVVLDHALGRAGPGGLDVTRQRQRAPAQVQHPQRLPGRGGRVDDRGDPAHVAELQVGRIGEVDVGLGGVVDEQGPPAGPARIGDQFGGARVDLLHDRLRRPRG